MEFTDISTSLEEKKSEKLVIDRFIFLIGFTINITQIFLGINVSVSDVFMIFLIILLFLTNSIYLTKKTTIYFIILLSLRFFSTMQISNWLNISISFIPIFITFQKFIISLLYFILFISVLTINPKTKELFFKGLKYGSLILGTLSLIIYFIGPAALRSIVLFGEIRMRGFMNDPNYFAYMQICGFCIWYLKGFKRKLTNFLAMIIYPTTILLSASKTGLIVFICMLSVLSLKKFFTKSKSPAKLATLFLVISGSLTMFYVFFDSIMTDLLAFTQSVPQLERIYIVFENFSGAITEGGSGRVDAWETAYRLIIDTHFMGIGFMDYSSVAKVISGSPTIAHNTFLQLAVEWGIGPLVVGLIFLVKQSIIELFNKNWIVVALVLGTIFFSFSISLQNSRILWILLAMLFSNKSVSDYSKNSRVK